MCDYIVFISNSQRRYLFAKEGIKSKFLKLIKKKQQKDNWVFNTFRLNFLNTYKFLFYSIPLNLIVSFKIFRYQIIQHPLIFSRSGENILIRVCFLINEDIILVFAFLDFPAFYLYRLVSVLSDRRALGLIR